MLVYWQKGHVGNIIVRVIFKIIYDHMVNTDKKMIEILIIYLSKTLNKITQAR